MDQRVNWIKNMGAEAVFTDYFFSGWEMKRRRKGGAIPGHPVGMKFFRTPCRDVIWDSLLLLLLMLL